MARKIWLHQIAARSPKAIKYFMSQTQGIRTELRIGKRIACAVCKPVDQYQKPVPLYRMEKPDKTVLYFCGLHYCQIAKSVGTSR